MIVSLTIDVGGKKFTAETDCTPDLAKQPGAEKNELAWYTVHQLYEQIVFKALTELTEALGRVAGDQKDAAS